MNNVKFNTESELVITKNKKDEDELLKNGVCCKDIINGCHSNNNSAQNNIDINQRNKNDYLTNPITSKPSSYELDFMDENVLNGRNKSQSDDSNVASSNNSTDNLSYISDNCIVEEIMMSDEELSRNSDDCIYAYRGGDVYDDGLPNEARYGVGVGGGSCGVVIGGGVGIVPGGNIRNADGHFGNDDETDFLEMDFEPDPSSELEQTIEITDKKCINNDLINNFKYQFNTALAETEFKSNNEAIKSYLNKTTDTTMKVYSPDINSMQKLNEQQYFTIDNIDYDNDECNITSNNDIKINHNLIMNCNKNDNKHFNPIEMKTKVTGTKRKKVLEKNIKSSSSSSPSLLLSSLPYNNTKSETTTTVTNNKEKNLNNDIDMKNIKCKTTYPKTQCRTFNEFLLLENDDACLDCLEKEFLSKTIGKNTDSIVQCIKCSSLNRIPIKYNNDEFLQNTNIQTFPSSSCSSSTSTLYFDIMKNNDFQHSFKNNMIKRTTATSFGQTNYYQTIDDSMRNCILENLSFGDSQRKSAKFSSLNVDEKTIVQALDKLDLKYNKDIIIEYCNKSREIQQINDVPEFIVYMSKKNCDYKRIIKIIRMACKDKFHIEYIPDTKIKLPEIVEINVYDIIQRWNRKSDLGKLKKLDKRFTEMNILGKIINLLRQAQQRNVKPMGEIIKIPQYYKTGFICITKI